MIFFFCLCKILTGAHWFFSVDEIEDGLAACAKQQAAIWSAAAAEGDKEKEKEKVVQELTKGKEHKGQFSRQHTLCTCCGVVSFSRLSPAGAAKEEVARVAVDPEFLAELVRMGNSEAQRRKGGMPLSVSVCLSVSVPHCLPVSVCAGGKTEAELKVRDTDGVFSSSEHRLQPRLQDFKKAREFDALVKGKVDGELKIVQKNKSMRVETSMSAFVECVGL